MMGYATSYHMTLSGFRDEVDNEMTGEFQEKK